jgi:transcriptional regulator with XRE-family HTH domain
MSKKASAQELSPQDIRRIRTALGLSQVEAGELLGGGPRAFSKYESGSIRPTAGISALLAVLDTNPRAIEALTGHRTAPIASQDLKPFEVSAAHVSALGARKLVSLVSRMLSAEALASNLPRSSLHVSSSITTPDGGEDGRFEWSGEPLRTEFLPRQKCAFQMKATTVSPSQAANEIGEKAKGLKPMVRAALDSGGVYIIVCNQTYPKQQILARSKAMYDRALELGLNISEDQVDFWDADRLAVWINARPSVAVWLLGQTQPGLTGPFRDWSHSAARTEHESSNWIEDPRFPSFRADLREAVGEQKRACRVIGQSGVGKSRLTLEALGPTEEEDRLPVRYSDIVLFANASDAGPIAIKNALTILADSRTRAIVVVDDCDLELHNDLERIVGRSTSRLSLVTIDNHYTEDEKSFPGRLFIGTAADAVVEGILQSRLPTLADEDRRRLIKFSGGYPRIAQLLCDGWLNDIPVAAASDESLIDKIILGRSSTSSDRLRSAAQLVSVFGLLGFSGELTQELDEVAHLTPLSASDIRIGLTDLKRRDVVQMKGRLATLQPKPVALAVAAQQWREWDHEIWEEVLVGNLPLRLRLQSAKQLALINTNPIAAKVAQHLCRRSGPLDSVEGLSAPGNAEVLSSLAEIDTRAVADLLERLIDPLDAEELVLISGQTRRHVVWALEKVAFLKDTFEQGAELLLRLAMAENESIGNNSTGQFKALFPSLLANTEAGPAERLSFIDGELARNNPERLKIVAEALLAGAQTNHFSRMVGSESHGSRPALQPWRPETWGQVWDYVRQCTNRLVDLAGRNDEVGAIAKREFGRHIRGFVGKGLINEVDGWIRAIGIENEYWPEAIESLGDILQYDADGMDQADIDRVRVLMTALSPRTLPDRLKFLVTEMPWDYPCDEQLEYEARLHRQTNALESLAKDLIEFESDLSTYLPALSAGDQRQSTQFGSLLLKHSANPKQLLADIERAYLAALPNDRNYGLLAGAVLSMKDIDREVHNDFKRRASQIPDLANTLPYICLRSGIEDEDIALVIAAIRNTGLDARYLQHWMLGGELSKRSPEVVAPLFRSLIAMGGKYYVTCVDIFGMYVYQRRELLNEFRSLILLMADNVRHFGDGLQHRSEAHHFQDIALWLLDKGEGDPDACQLATIFAQRLSGDPDGPGIDVIKELLRKLLEKFPLIVWPYLGQAISESTVKSWRLREALGDQFSFSDEKDPAILSIPEELLFAWCGANLDTAPAFLASVLPVISSRDSSVNRKEFHPWMKRLIDQYGNRTDVQNAISSNMHTYGWTGSLTTYYALYQEPFEGLKDSPDPEVRKWAKRTLVNLQNSIDRESTRDDEESAHWG